MCTISLSLAKPGEAGRTAACDVLHIHHYEVLPGGGPDGRGPAEKTQDNADTALIRLCTSNKASRTRHSAARATGFV